MKNIILILFLIFDSVFCINRGEQIINRSDCIKAIFSEYDKNYDDFLDKWEYESLQYDTNPELPLTWQNYKTLCHLTNAVFALGLDFSQLSKTYNELSILLGTNLVNDFNKIFKEFKLVL